MRSRHSPASSLGFAKTHLKFVRLRFRFLRSGKFPCYRGDWTFAVRISHSITSMLSILDRNLRLQFLAGMAVDDNREGLINAEMLVFRRFPANLFVGSDQDVNALRLRPG